MLRDDPPPDVELRDVELRDVELRDVEPRDDELRDDELRDEPARDDALRDDPPRDAVRDEPPLEADVLFREPPAADFFEAVRFDPPPLRDDPDFAVFEDPPRVLADRLVVRPLRCPSDPPDRAREPPRAELVREDPRDRLDAPLRLGALGLPLSSAPSAVSRLTSLLKLLCAPPAVCS